MHLLLLVLALLWFQLFWALIPTWRFGEYYGYGWFVPVLAAGLVWRRWHLLAAGERLLSAPSLGQAARSTGGAGILPAANSTAPAGGTPVPPHRVAGWVVALGVLAVVAMVPLQFITAADPGWRPPLLLQALITFGLTHFLVWQGFGRRFSLGLLPVTIFALSAVPYPWQFEQQLIRTLTGTVVGLTREIFLLTGQPVELVGERLSMGTEAVDVSDGAIQNCQSND